MSVVQNRVYKKMFEEVRGDREWFSQELSGISKRVS